MENKIAHCQICARDIKATTGLIAHHGYQRPGMGWQTASCDGARQLPYETSRSFIPTVIERYKLYEKNHNDLADEMFMNPAEVITKQTYNHYSAVTTTEQFERPEDFDATKAVNDEYPYYQEYAKEFRRNYMEHRKYAKDILETINWLQKRYDDWKKVA